LSDFCLSQSIDGSWPSSTARFANHSCSCNCKISTYPNPNASRSRAIADLKIQDESTGTAQPWLVTKKHVAPGEELTYNYGYSPYDKAIFECRCGSPSCVGLPVSKVVCSALVQPVRPPITDFQARRRGYKKGQRDASAKKDRRRILAPCTEDVPESLKTHIQFASRILFHSPSTSDPRTRWLQCLCIEATAVLCSSLLCTGNKPPKR